MKPSEKLNSPQEWSLPSPTLLKSLSSAPSNTVKEPSTSSVNTPDVPPVHHQDGFQVPLPTSWPKSSKNQDFWSLLTQRATDKLLSRLHTLTFQPSLCATLTLHWTSLTSLFHATTEFQRPSLWFSGCWLEKCKDLEVKSPLIRNGTLWLTCSLPETLKPSEVNKISLKDNNKKLTRLKLITRSNLKLLKLELKKIGDFDSDCLYFEFLLYNFYLYVKIYKMSYIKVI